MNSHTIAIFRIIVSIIICLILLIIYIARTPTADEDIIAASISACLTEKSLRQSKIDYVHCIGNKTSIEDRNYCNIESYRKNSIKYEMVEDNILPSYYYMSEYNDDKKTSLLPLSNGKIYVANCAN